MAEAMPVPREVIYVHVAYTAGITGQAIFAKDTERKLMWSDVFYRVGFWSMNTYQDVVHGWMTRGLH